MKDKNNEMRFVSTLYVVIARRINSKKTISFFFYRVRFVCVVLLAACARVFDKKRASV